MTQFGAFHKAGVPWLGCGPQPATALAVIGDFCAWNTAAAAPSMRWVWPLGGARGGLDGQRSLRTV